MRNKLLLLFVFLILKPSISYSLVEIDITRGNLDPLPISVSPFFADEISKEKIKKNLDIDNLGIEISKVIENNLRKTGLFDTLDKESFLQKPDIAHLKPRFEDWSLINSQVLITGKVTSKVINEKDYIRIEFKLWDVLGAKMVDGFSLTTVPTNWRRVGHKISDKVYQLLTGESGYFDTRIIYVAEEGPKTQRVKKLAIMDQDGFNTKYLTLGNELVLTPRFNPTNQMVTYLSCFRNMPRVYLLNIETGKQEVVGDFPGMTFAPRFSPDGKKIIMSLAKDGNSDIYVMDLKSRVVTRLTTNSAIDTSPSYSPDGKKITFNSDRGGSQQIYVMDNDGRNQKRISNKGGNYATPVWSPRGDLIAFTKNFKGSYAIGVMRTNGEGERLLTENWYQEAPSWSPNGRVLTFYRETPANEAGQGHSSTLWSIDLTGFNERKIDTPQDGSDPSWSNLLQ